MRTTVALASALLMTFLPVAGWVHAGPTDPVTPVPCVDARGCPDLIIDPNAVDPFVTTSTFAASDCAVKEGEVQEGTRTLLRFTYTTPNLGPGALIIGNPAHHPEWFDRSKCHHHYHFEEYADYRLWQPAGFLLWDALRTAQPDKTPEQVLAEHPELASFYIAGHKQGFCVIDIYQYPELAPVDPETYIYCNDQGLGVGWADSYGWWLDGQWIDVTGLAAGDYELELETNPERLFTETDYTNNRVHQTVTL